jgi:hypothetical protein
MVADVCPLHWPQNKENASTPADGMRKEEVLISTLLA